MPRWERTDKPETWKATYSEFDFEGLTITADAEYVGPGEGPIHQEWHPTKSERLTWIPTRWKVTLHCDQFPDIEAPFFQGSGHKTPPSAELVLAALALDAACSASTGSLREFCADLGYSLDSREAERQFHECQETELRLRRAFGNKFDSLLEWAEQQ